MSKVLFDVFYISLECVFVVGLFVYFLSSCKRKIILYGVSIFILCDALLMWQATTYFSNRYGKVVFDEPSSVASILEGIKPPERLFVLYPRGIYDEKGEKTWRKWGILLTGNYPLYHSSPMLDGMAMNLVPQYLLDFYGKFGLSFFSPEAEVDFSKAKLFGVSTVIAVKKEHQWNADFRLETEGNGYQAYHTSDAGPRFYLVENIIPFKFDWKGSSIDPRFIDENYDPVSYSFVADEDISEGMRSLVYKNGEQADRLSSTKYGLQYFKSRAGSLFLKKYDWDYVNFEANISKPSLLVLTDSWYPGWNVYVNSKKAKLVRANYIFRGVLLEPGNYTVLFRFENIFIKIGRCLSIIGFLCIFGWCMYSYSYKRTALENKA